MANPCCDVTKIVNRWLKINQDGGQFVDLGENISWNKTDIKIL